MLEIRGRPCAVEKDGSREVGWMAGAGHLAWIQIQNEKEKKRIEEEGSRWGRGITWWAMSTVTFLACGHPETQHSVGALARSRLNGLGQRPVL